MASPIPPPRIAFDELSVVFGATRAVDRFQLEAQRGQVIGLLGHNGAGKSTIVNVATGAVPWTTGTVTIDGAEIAHGSSPRQIAKLGVAVVHQEPALAPNLSVLDNLELGRTHPRRRRDRVIQAKAALKRVGSELPLDLPVGVLSLGERQLVDLARGYLEGEIKVLFLDEPTAALGAAETVALHELIRSLAASGTVVFYVSHRLPDILDVCTRIVVMNSGRVVMDRAAAGLHTPDLSEALAPGTVRQSVDSTARDSTGFECRSGETEITARQGEVVGLFGMAASDQFSLLESYFGLRAGDGHASLLGQPYRPRSPADSIKAGVYFVPADRETDGLLATAPARENVLLPWYGTRINPWWIDERSGADVYERSRVALNVQGPGGDAPISEFSGGNRQKHLLARWMFPETPTVLLLSQPTQGVDVAAKADIVRAVRELAASGTTVVVASAESDEITSMCDRAYVLYQSRTATLTAGADLSDQNLLDALLALANPIPEIPIPVDGTNDV